MHATEKSDGLFDNPKRLLTVDEAAKYLRQSRGTIYNKISDGRLKAEKLGEGAYAPVRIPFGALISHMHERRKGRGRRKEKEGGAKRAS